MSQRIDARGLLCPLPVLRLRKRLLALPPGTRVTLIATDRAALIDVPHFCAESGHILIETRETAPGETEFTVERRPDA
ncbi:sulfurtransferase TusA family protein [Paracoccus sp. (in: a-proteobacteria)]|uniref:sulfurtransferase TusA family protein n=1 Tax=Paracoccus sp. TaxID=267 RepID=UPI0035B4BB0E